MKNIIIYAISIFTLVLMSQGLFAQETEESANDQEVQGQKDQTRDEIENPTEGFAQGTLLELIDTTQVETHSKKGLPFVDIYHKVYQDSIVLRWAPSNRTLWHKSNFAGYILEKISYQVMDTDGLDSIPEDYAKQITSYLPSPDKPIKPYDSAKWAPYFPNKDKYALIAAGAVAGQLEVSEEEGFAVKGSQDRSVFGLVLLSADLSQLAANGLGLRYADKDIEKGNTYEYRITTLDSMTLVMMDSLNNISLDDLMAVGDSSNATKLFNWRLKGRTIAEYSDSVIALTKNVADFQAISGDKSVSLMWNANDGVNEFSGFFIERSEDGGLTYDSLTKDLFIGEPIIWVDSAKDEATQIKVYQFVDHLDTNYVEYTYRITGIDAFADPSAPAMARGMGKDLTPPTNPVLKSGEYLKSTGEIQLVYSLPNVPEDLSDLYFEYAYHVDSAFVRYEAESLDPQDTVYRHAPEPDEYSHYFRMVAVDTAQNKSRSFPIFVNIPDTIPPPVPNEIHAVIDTLGEVEIKWTDEHVDELGFLGYRLYYSNSPDHEFTQLTTKPIIANFYIYHIPLNTLTEKIYYKVQAVDKSYNHSEFSEVVEAVKPDTLKPVTPVFKKINATESSLDLSWVPSSSRDVARQRLIRKNGEELVEFEFDHAARDSFRDSTVQKGIIYEYYLQAIDNNNLRSDLSFPLRGKIVDKKRMNGIEKLQFQYSKDEKRIIIDWKKGETEGDFQYMIYRSKDSEKVKNYKAVASNMTEFSDQIDEPGTYYYAVRVVHKDGSKSLLSERIKVKVN